MDFTNTINNLKTLLDNKISLLNTEIAAQIAGTPKPSYTLKDESVSWNEWRAELQNEINDLVEQLSNLILLQNSLNPFELGMKNIL